MSKSIKVNAFFKTLMSIVNIVFPLLTAPYVARVLSVDGFTEYNKIVSMMTWFTPFAVFGVYTYGMRTISQIKNDKQAVSALFTKLFCFSIFASIIVVCAYFCIVFFSSSFANYRGIYAVAAIQLLFVCFATDWANEAFENYGFILAKTFCCRVLYLTAVFVFVKNADDVFVYVLLSSLSLVVNNLLTFTFAKSRIPFTKTKIKNIALLSKSLGVVFLLENSSMLYTIFDRFVLTWWGSKLDLTYYNVSQTIVMALTSVTSSVLLVSIPRLSHLWANGKKDEYYDVQQKTSNTFMALQAPCCIGMACLSLEVIFFYSGSNYLPAYLSLLFFASRYCISAFDMILSKQMLLATGNERVLTKIYYLGGIFNILCKTILVISGNLTPELCIITTACSDLLTIILQVINIKKLGIHITILSKKTYKYVLTSLVFVPVIFVVKQLIPYGEVSSIIIRTIVSIIICATIYVLMLMITKDKLVSVVLKKYKKL